MKMKRRILIALIFALGLSFILPTISSAWWRVGVGYYNGWGHYRPYGWYHPRVYVGTAFVNPWYVTIPPPVYVYQPPVVYTNPVPPSAYAYPDPEFAVKYKDKNPPGEWVTIPGQWVDGKWIPSHKTWVPVNP